MATSATSAAATASAHGIGAKQWASVLVLLLVLQSVMVTVNWMMATWAQLKPVSLIEHML